LLPKETMPSRQCLQGEEGRGRGDDGLS
jgi:hypothetical protein